MSGFSFPESLISLILSRDLVAKLAASRDVLQMPIPQFNNNPSSFFVLSINTRAFF